jgi:hypothetical protein
MSDCIATFLKQNGLDADGIDREGLLAAFEQEAEGRPVPRLAIRVRARI